MNSHFITPKSEANLNIILKILANNKTRKKEKHYKCKEPNHYYIIHPNNEPINKPNFRKVSKITG